MSLDRARAAALDVAREVAEQKAHDEFMAASQAEIDRMIAELSADLAAVRAEVCPPASVCRCSHGVTCAERRPQAAVGGEGGVPGGGHPG